MTQQHRLSAQVVMSHDDQSVLNTAVLDAVKLLEDPSRVLMVGPTWMRNSAVIEFYVLGELPQVTVFADAFKRILDTYSPVVSSLVGFTNEEKTE